MNEPLRTRLAGSSTLLAGAVLAIVVVALFGRVVTFPFIAFDDAEFILRNPQVTDAMAAPIDLLMTPRVGYIVPVTIAVEALLFALSGGAAWSFHAAALVLHGLFGLQLFAFARRLGMRTSLAFGAALVFVVHPIVAQPVAWAICLKDLLMANLLLAATRAFLDVADPKRQPSPQHRAQIAIGLGSLAMLAKPSATLIGFAWLAYAWRRDAGADENASSRSALRSAGVMAAVGVVIGFASRYSHTMFLGADAAPTWTPSAPLIVLGRQALHVLWPVDLLVVYPQPYLDPAPRLAAGLGAAVALLGAWLLLRIRHRRGALLVALIALSVYLPTSDLLPFARALSDSYAYVPLACACVGAGLFLEHAFATRPLPRGVAALGFALALALAFGTHVQLPRWRGGVALWEPVVRAHPRLAMAQRLLGDELAFRNAPKQAVEAYRRAFAADYDPRYLLEFGTLLGMAERVEDAECVLIEATAYGPNRGYALFNYAALLAFHAADHVPRYVGPARNLLREFDRAHRAGQVSFPAALEAGLATQLARVNAQAVHDVAWPRRNCRVLQAR